MTLKDDLQLKVAEFARSSWGDIPNGQVVPSSESLTFGNSGTRIDATVLYADIDGSTNMVDNLTDTMAAEYYKAYLHCAAKIIKSTNGTITAYDGDRVMAIFVGEEQLPDAVSSALKINWAVVNLINPTFAAMYGQQHRPLGHTIGIDKSQILAAKTGVRIDSDLVWVGPAANYAAKLNGFDGIDANYPIRITEQAMRALGMATFFRTYNGQTIWEGPYYNLKRGGHYRTDCVMDI